MCEEEVGERVSCVRLTTMTKISFPILYRYRYIQNKRDRLDSIKSQHHRQPLYKIDSHSTVAENITFSKNFYNQKTTIYGQQFNARNRLVNKIVGTVFGGMEWWIMWWTFFSLLFIFFRMARHCIAKMIRNSGNLYFKRFSSMERIWKCLTKIIGLCRHSEHAKRSILTLVGLNAHPMCKIVIMQFWNLTVRMYENIFHNNSLNGINYSKAYKTFIPAQGKIFINPDLMQMWIVFYNIWCEIR